MVKMASVGKTLMVGASLSGLWVGCNLICHGGFSELPLAMSVVLGSRGL